MSADPSSERRAAAALAFAPAFALSYVVQRILALSDEEPGILRLAHIPFSFRVGVAALHGLIAVIAVGLVPDRATALLLGSWRRFVPALTAALAAATFVWA
jgi:hypothetical protein